MPSPELVDKFSSKNEVQVPSILIQRLSSVCSQVLKVVQDHGEGHVGSLLLSRFELYLAL